MSHENTQGYSVGYGKPPQASQYQKGQSGNPLGRPRNKVSIKSLLNKTLEEKVMTTENGEQKAISKFEVMMKQLVNKACSGDIKSQQTVIRLSSQIEAEMNGEDSLRIMTPEQDKKLLADLRKRFTSSSTEQTDNHKTEQQR